jgi:hypothetical protein
MDLIRDHVGLYVAREPDNRSSVWDLVTAKRQPLERVDRVWRGTVMDTYALEKLTGWTPDLAPPPDTPLFRWRVLADSAQPGNEASQQMIANSSSTGASSFETALSRLLRMRSWTLMVRSTATPRVSNHEAVMRDRRNSLLAVALAQQVLGEVGERGARQRGERQRTGHVDGGEAEAGG